ncbi:MAG: TetR/AcrR family transcriptional regulator [Phycisphaeraceae bacterium]
MTTSATMMLRSAPTNGSLSREQILHATHACYMADGYDGTTIRAIAGRLDCAVGSIYRYFHDKRELLLACGSAVFEPLLEQVQRRELEPAVSFRRYVELAAEHDALYRLLFWLSVADDRPAVPRVVAELLEAWAEDIAEAPTYWATAHGLLMLGTPTAQTPLPPHRNLPKLKQESVAIDITVDDGAYDSEPEDITLL